jgi:hypothetical protein
VKIDQNLGVQNVPKVEICYIVVSTFFGPSGPPPDPPKSDIFWPPLDEKYRRFCGEWHFYEVNLWGRFWGVKSGEFLQKSAKFQKICFLGVRVPEIEIYRFLMILDPPMANDYKRHFWTDFRSIFNTHFEQFIMTFLSYFLEVNFSINFQQFWDSTFRFFSVWFLSC